MRFKADNIILAGWVFTTIKIAFVDNKCLNATLLEDIDESQIPEIYGGKLSLVPIQESTT